MISPLAPLESVGVEPSRHPSPHRFPTPAALPSAAWQGRGPRRPSRRQNDPVPEALVFQLCVTGSFKKAPTLQEPLSLGTSNPSLVSVMYAICPLSVLMPLFPKTSFAASTYSRRTRNTGKSNLRKPSRSSMFRVQMPHLMCLKCSADDGLMFQCSFLGISSQEQPFCLRKAWNCFW